MEITSGATRATKRAPEQWFTGAVWAEELVPALPPDRPHIVSVTFTPGARTAWHTHPHGQTLYVTAGHGLAGRDDGTIEPIAAGDTVWFAPGERHWHGAAPEAQMTHVAVQQADASGAAVAWQELVADSEYAGG